MALAVPGNHDVTVSPDALARAVERSAGSTFGALLVIES